jgi:hypothetical protein
VVTVNGNYIFNSNVSGSVDDEIVGDHYDDGRISDEVWDHHTFWSDLNGTKVTVISVQTIKKMNSCDEWAKVFISDKGFKSWFSAHVKELTPIGGAKNSSSSGACSCDLAAIMVRGCQCGGS